MAGQGSRGLGHGCGHRGEVGLVRGGGPCRGERAARPVRIVARGGPLVVRVAGRRAAGPAAGAVGRAPPGGPPGAAPAKPVATVVTGGKNRPVACRRVARGVCDVRGLPEVELLRERRL
jgi:hypothetical protein